MSPFNEIQVIVKIPNDLAIFKQKEKDLKTSKWLNLISV